MHTVTTHNIVKPSPHITAEVTAWRGVATFYEVASWSGAEVSLAADELAYEKSRITTVHCTEFDVLITTSHNGR